MDDNLKEKLEKIHQKNRLVWGAVLSGVIILILASMLFFFFNIINPLPIVDPQKADNITMFIILVFIIAIFYIKQSILTPVKLYEKSKNPKLKLSDQLSSLLRTGDGKSETFLKCIQLYNRNILIIWFLADLVIVTAFVSFILAPILNKIVMYGLVSLFSLLINFPSFTVYNKIYGYIYE